MAQGSAAEVIVPPGALPGDTVGIIAPAGAVDKEAMDRGKAALEILGFKSRLGRHVYRRHRYLAGSAAERLADLHSMISDPAVRAIFCARGGYGCVDLLPSIDVMMVRANPKLVCGYSDASILLNFLACTCGVASLHGPMVVSDLAAGASHPAAERLKILLADAGADWTESGLERVSGGVGIGPMVGGCLSSIVSILGTPFAVPTAGKVLFLEEVGEKPYRVERMLTQLRLAGCLGSPAAVVLGCFSGCGGSEEQEILRDVITEALATADYPVVSGFPAGHRPDQMAFPIGLPVEVDAERGTVRSLGQSGEL